MRVKGPHVGVLVALLTVLLALTTAEIAIRSVSRDWREGESFTSTPLVPRNWSKVARFYRNLLDRESANSNFMVYDDVMGWTVDPSRQRQDGMD